MSDQRTDAALVERAAAMLNPHRVGDRLLGDVASLVVSMTGAEYGGVSIDTASGTGFCAEHAAIAAMVTAGKYRIERMVAVWRCGVMREMSGSTSCLRVADVASSSSRSTLRTSTLR